MNNIESSKSVKKKCLFIFLVIAAAAAVIQLTPVKKLLDINELYRQKEFLLASVKANYFQYIIIYYFTYIIMAGITLPGSALMSILGGFLFGPAAGLVLISVSATSGAFAVFWLVRHFAGNSVQQKYSEKLKDFNREISKNGVNYLITLRIIPVIPFFLVNILAAFTRISAVTFLWTTVVGMIPGSIIYVYIGYTGSNMDKKGYMSPGIYGALSILGLLSIMPVVIKKIKKNRAVKQ